MTVVVDASVATKWFIKEPRREQALKVLDAPVLHAPDLIIAEVANVAWKKAVRGEITGDQARFICASVARYFHLLHRSEALIGRAIEIALGLRHPVYNCLYLACAERIGGRLITADEKLVATLTDPALASITVHIDAFAQG
jgi:predicted nucleic acid-binding protein